MLVPKKAVKFVDVTDTVATNLSISFHRHRKYTKNYRSHCYPNSRASGRAHTCHCKQAVQRLITSVKANLELFTSAKSTSLSRDISKQAARICLLQPIWNTAAKATRPFYCSSSAAALHSPTSPLLFLLRCFQITFSIFAFAQAYKCSCFPSLPVCFSPLLSPPGSSN